MPFRKGQSGNTKGRPLKGHSITEAVKLMLNNNPEAKAALADKILKWALAGDMTAVKLLWNYMDGMPQQDMKIDGEMKVEGVVIYKPEKNTE